MHDVLEALETAAWAEAEGIATEDQLALLQGDKRGWQAALERILDATEDDYDEVQLRVQGPERAQVVADFERQLALLDAAYDRLVPPPPPPAPKEAIAPEVVDGVSTPPGAVELQASWTSGKVVVWAGGPEATPATHEELLSSTLGS